MRIDMRPVSSSLSRTSIFTLNGPNQDAYFGSVLVIPTPKGYQSLTLLAWRIRRTRGYTGSVSCSCFWMRWESPPCILCAGCWWGAL